MSNSKQLVFIDDSGDPGFKKDSSAVFVMSAIVFENQEEATRTNHTISKLRKQLGWSNNFEFKFRKNSKKVSKLFLESIKKNNFKIYAVYIDKKERCNYAGDLYYFAIRELLKRVPISEAVVKIDGSLSKDFRRKVVSDLRKATNVRGRKIQKIGFQDSASSNLIQLVDTISGSINRSLQPERTDSREYINIIESKIVWTYKLN